MNRAATRSLRTTEPVPYYHLLGLRARVEEIDAALAQPGDWRMPEILLHGLRAALGAELEQAERQWAAAPAWTSRAA